MRNSELSLMGWMNVDGGNVSSNGVHLGSEAP
jgi:hypothetical protein